jgi:Leucine-rich repeat (LRR) protein
VRADQGGRLDALPSALWDLPHLAELIADNNRLTHVSSRIGEAQALESLSLVNNSIRCAGRRVAVVLLNP